MRSYSNGTWFLMGFVAVVMLSLIDIIEVRIPAGALSTDLMLGVTALGCVSIFVWLNRHREPSKPQKQIAGFRRVGRVGEMTVYESYFVEERLDALLNTREPAASKQTTLRKQTASLNRG